MRGFCDEMEDLLVGQRDLPGPHPRHRRDPRARSPCRYGLSGANLRASGRRLGPPPRPAARRWPGTRSTGRSGPTPTATASPATGCASRRCARRRSIVDQLLDGMPGRADHGQGAPHHQGARGRGLGRRPRTRSARWATTSSARATSGPFRVKIRSASFNNISVVPWVLRGVYVPDVITILASLYFILGDIDR